RVVAVRDVEVADGDLAFALRALRVDHRVERGEGDAHVGRVRGDALVTGPQDGVAAVVAVEGRTARPRLALVARPGGVAEVGAAGALEQVAADGGHVPQLRRRP